MADVTSRHIFHIVILWLVVIVTGCGARQDHNDPLLQRARSLHADAQKATSAQYHSSTIGEVIELTTQRIESGELSGELLAELYAMRGDGLIEHGDPPSALQDLNEATRLAPNKANYWFLRALANELVDNYPEAISDLGRVLEIDPTYGNVDGNRAVLLLDIGDFERAIDDLDVAIEQDPASSELLEYRGDAFAQLGQLNNALVDYRSAIFLGRQTHERVFGSDRGGYDPGELGLRMKIAGMYERLGNAEAALREYEEILKIEPRHAEAQAGREQLRPATADE